MIGRGSLLQLFVLAIKARVIDYSKTRHRFTIKMINMTKFNCVHFQTLGFVPNGTNT